MTLSDSGALRVHAGPRARLHLAERGLRPSDLAVIAAAAGGPKALILHPLDRFIFTRWLSQSSQTVHLIGASIGAWRMASACAVDVDAALTDMANAYVGQHYEHEPGRSPTASQVSASFRRTLERSLGPRAGGVLAAPRYRLHVVASRGRHVLSRQGRLRSPLGYAGAYVANALQRKALGLWLERVVFSDPRGRLPFALDDFRSRQVHLTSANFINSVLASCSIPFWLDAVHDIPGAPRGAYWDGGITDYHLHLNYADMPEGLVLIPHFGAQLVPGWLDKAWTSRHQASSMLDNVIVLSPSPEWIRTLPNGKLPDRDDFLRYRDDLTGRMQVWREAIASSQRLADEFEALVQADRPIQALPLA